MHSLKENLRIVRAGWLPGLALVAGLDLVATWLLAPALRWVTTALLKKAELPFVSVPDVVMIVTHHPLVVLGLLVTVLAVITLLGLQVLVALCGLELMGARRFSVRAWLNLVVQRLRAMPWATRLAWVPLLVVSMPVATLLFRTPLLANIKADAFVLDYLTRRPIILVLGVLCYLACLFLAGRAYSWPRLTHALGVAVLFGGGSWLVNGVVVLINRGNAPTDLALSGLVVAQLVAEFSLTATGLVIVTAPDDLDAKKLPVRDAFISLAVLAVFILAILPADRHYMTAKLPRPITVAHRGVDGSNGVPNSITALEKTHAAAHPDYVEMDVHETADGQFIVVHDDNLKKLTGVNKAPGQLTLRELDKLSTRENGHRARLVSFDDYLAAAERVHQRLIVELKATKYDHPDLVARFNRRYGARLVKDGDMVHSLDYAYVMRLHAINPAIKVLYCMAYNFTNPPVGLTGVTGEYSTLNHRFIDAAHRHHQLVLAWTVNRPEAMRQALLDQADGVITDRVSILNQVIKRIRLTSTPANRLANYFQPW